MSLYQPFIRHWLARQGVSAQDADDLAQDVFVIRHRELPRFQHNGRAGAFRAWLRAITVNRSREFWRAGRCRVQTPGGSTFLELPQQLDDPTSSLSREWDAEHNRAVCRLLVGIMERDFGATTVQAFRRLVFDGASGAEVSAELGLSRAAVFVAQSRVLRRLREEAVGLLDE